MKRLAIIPARKGSKRIPNKNVKDFCGRPMIAHAIESCRRSGIFDDIHISTDSDEIAAAASDSGYAPLFMRPDSLSGDNTSMMEVLRYVVGEYKKRGIVPDVIALVYATSPLINPEDLAKACAAFENGNRQKPVLAVTPYPAPIEHAFHIDRDHEDVLMPVSPKSLAMRTQDIEESYYDAGMFAFYSSSFILEQAGSGDFTAFRGYAVPNYRVTDIDWPEDWTRAEMLYKALHTKT